jgi:hypothetical protein
MLIKDSLQIYTENNYPDLKNKGIFLDIIIYSLLAYNYYFGNSEIYTIFFKYLFVFLLVRFLFNITTNYQKKNDKQEYKNYFQLDAYIGIFVLIIFLGILDLNIYTQIPLILLFTLFSSCIYGNTTNNLLTVVLVYNLLQVNF